MSLQWYALPSKPNNEEPLWRGVHGPELEVLHLQSRRSQVAPRSRKFFSRFPGYRFTNTDLPRVGCPAGIGMPRTDRPMQVLLKLLEKHLVLPVVLAG